MVNSMEGELWSTEREKRKSRSPSFQIDPVGEVDPEGGEGGLDRTVEANRRWQLSEERIGTKV